MTARSGPHLQVLLGPTRPRFAADATMTEHVSVIVVGAGISGLVCAYALRQRGISARVVEATGRPGGMIRSERRQGYLLELGPQSFSGTEAMREIYRELKVNDLLMEAPGRAPRYLLVDGQLKAVPLSPPAFFASSLFGGKTKWSLLRDIWGRSAPPESDESLADFTRRKFTPELLEKLVGPFVSGIYAGEPEKLSLRAAFPQVYEAERTAGSVIRGMMGAAKQKSKATAAADSARRRGRRPTLQTFREGNETLTQALAARLESALQTGTCVSEIRRPASDAAADSARYLVALNAENSTEQITADHVVVATPTDVAARLLRDVSAELSSALAGVEYAPVAVVSLGYANPTVGRELDGFGFLIPRSAGLRTLGTVWNSSLFPERAPTGHALVTSFVGGATDPEAVALSEGELSELVHRELTPILKLSTGPAFASVTNYPQALPQYNLGHAERVARVEKTLAAFPGLFLAGNYLRGPAIGACVEQALAVAEAIAARTGQSRGAAFEAQARKAPAS